jgi:hypothetical protein
MSNRIRIIEYEFLFWEELERMGKLAQLVQERLGRLEEVCVLRCTDRTSARITIVGGVKASRLLIANENAATLKGLTIARSEFPVMIKGWLYRTGEE